MPWADHNQLRQEVCILGERAYADARKRITGESFHRQVDLELWNDTLAKAALKPGTSEADRVAQKKVIAIIEAEKAQVDELGSLLA
jgi:hypothetical protein